MIKHIQQTESHQYNVINESDSEIDTCLNLMNGRHLMEVYYHTIPVFRCNMGANIEDDMLATRISYKGMVAYVQQSWRSAHKHCCGFPVPETFASHALINFCHAFELDHHSVEKEIREGRRDKDSRKTKSGITE